MKAALALLVIFNIIVALAVAAFFFRYSIIETVQGGEYVIVHDKQNDECQTGGGCAIFSHREWLQSLQQMLMQRGRGL